MVRNCYVLPVDDLEMRMVSQDVPEVLGEEERLQAAKDPLFLSKSDKVVTISHHLAHAYSAFAASPFKEGVVMVVDGVGNYRADVREDFPMADVNPLARESESYYKFDGSKIETLRKVWLEPVRGFLSDEFYYMPGLGALYSRVSSYIFADWNKCGEVMGLAPYGTPDAFKPLLDISNGELSIPEWGVDFNKPWLVDHEHDWEASPSHATLEGHGLADAGRRRAACCSIAQNGCAKRPAPRTSAWRAAWRSIAWPTGASHARPDSRISGFSRRPATTALRSAAPITVTWRC